MKRRLVIGLLGGAVANAMLPSRIRAADKRYRIVFVSPIGKPVEGDPWDGTVKAFLQGLRDLGYTEGRNLEFEFHTAEGKSERLAEIVARVLASPPDAIVAAGGGANEVAHAFKLATRTVPIVMANSSDPVEQKLVASLARPGGNITGFAGNTGPEFEAKRLQLLKEIAPNANRIAYLGLMVDWESPAARGVRGAAEKLGITMLHAEHTQASYDQAFASMEVKNAQAMFVARNPWNFSNRRFITQFAAGRRLPAVYPTREFSEVSGLLSYGPSLGDLYRRAAGHVDKILKGKMPADLPVEQPSKFELVINIKTAGELGMAIPPTVLALADDVIEQ